MAPVTEPNAPKEPAIERFQFVLPARLEYREAARAFLAYVCGRLSQRGALPADAGHRVISAFVEAFNNAVIHAYSGQPAGSIDVSLEVGNGRLRVEVRDQGVSFTPESVPEPDLDALPEGGMGLFIIRNFMDDVRYEREESHNVLIMEKTLVPPSGG